MISRTLRRGRAFAALVTGAMVASISIAGFALPASADQPAQKPTVTVSPSTDVDPSEPNDFIVQGEGFVGDGAAQGVYVLLGDASIWAGNAPLEAAGWLEMAWIQPGQITDGSFETTVTLTPDALQHEIDYTVATSAAHGLSTTDRSLDTFTPITLQPAEEPVVEADPVVTVSQTSELDPSVANEFVIQGEGFLGDGAAVGTYVLIGDASIWSGNGPLVADGWLKQVHVGADEITDGVFETTITIPAGDFDNDIDYTIATSAAHWLSASDRTLDTFTPLDVLDVPEAPAEDPEVTVSKTSDIARDGEQITVTGVGFLPNDETTGIRPPLAGKFTGVYVVLGQFASEWEPSEEVAGTARKPSLKTYWGVHAEDMRVIGGPAEGATEIKPDGTFEVTFNVSEDLEGFAPDKLANLGIYTYAGGGAVHAPFETFTKLTFADEEQEPGTDVTPEPTPEPTTEPAPEPTETVDPTPTPTPTCEAGVINDATLTWGVKESFRNYITGNIAKGSTSVSGANVAKSGDSFTWSAGKGTFDSATKTGEVSYAGSVKFVGHGGLLNVTFSKLEVTIKDKNTAVLSAKVYSTDANGDVVVNSSNVKIAKLDLAQAQRSSADGVIKYTDAPAVLTAAGAEAFVGFYDAGDALDPVSFQLRDGCSDAVLSGTSGNSGKSNTQPPSTPAPGAGAVGSNNAAETSNADEAANQAEQCVANSVSGATFSWGVKQAFTSYISGNIANGTVSTSGPSNSGGAFTWSGGSGSINTDKMMGSTRFGGSVNFSGHGGILKLTLANPRVVMSGTNTATLIVDANGTNMDGDSLSFPGVRFATLNLSAGSNASTGSSISYSGVPATLTSAGAQAFAGFYDAGASLDPVSFTLPLGATVECDTASGTLPSTGSDFAPIGLSLSLLVVGIAAAGIARKRKHGIYTA